MNLSFHMKVVHKSRLLARQPHSGLNNVLTIVTFLYHSGTLGLLSIRSTGAYALGTVKVNLF